MEVIEAGNKLYRLPAGQFNLAGELLEPGKTVVGSWTPERARKRVAGYRDFPEKAIPLLLAADKLRDQEPSPRWRANFDLTLARLLQAKVRCDSWDRAYRRFEAEPLVYVHTDPNKKANRAQWLPAWAPRFTEDIRVGKGGTGPGDPDLHSKTLQQARLAKSIFRRVIAQHPGTCWGQAAEVEIDWGMGVQIVPTYLKIYESFRTGPRVSLP